MYVCKTYKNIFAGINIFLMTSSEEKTDTYSQATRQWKLEISSYNIQL